MDIKIQPWFDEPTKKALATYEDMQRSAVRAGNTAKATRRDAEERAAAAAKSAQAIAQRARAEAEHKEKMASLERLYTAKHVEDVLLPLLQAAAARQAPTSEMVVWRTVDFACLVEKAKADKAAANKALGRQ
jgi:hypothetical protein